VSLWVPVVAAGVGGFVGVLGGILAAWLKGKADVDQWHRERRLDAYSDFIYRSSELIFALADYFAHHGTDQKPVKQRDLYAAIAAVDRASGRITMVAAAAARQRANNLMTFVADELAKQLAADQPPGDDATQAMQKVRQLSNAFGEEARRDLEPRELHDGFKPAVQRFLRAIAARGRSVLPGR